MNGWVKKNVGYNKVLLTLFILLLSFIAASVYNKMDSMPDKFIRSERYIADQSAIRDQYRTDQNRIENVVTEIQRDVKKILRAIR